MSYVMKFIQIFALLLISLLIGCVETKQKDTILKENELYDIRYFLSCSDLHIKKSNQPTYLYEEISEEEAFAHKNERAFYVGYFRNDILMKYEKKFRGETLIMKEIKNDE